MLPDAQDAGVSALREVCTPRYFIEECARFRAVMCSRGVSLEKKELAFQGLFLVALNVDPRHPEAAMADFAWSATAFEFASRMEWERARNGEAA